MTIPSPERILRAACWMTIFALALFVWSVFDPRPIPVMMAMSVGQGIGTLASLMFAYVIFTDLRRARVLGSKGPKK